VFYRTAFSERLTVLTTYGRAVLHSKYNTLLRLKIILNSG
jgi:hypothetical protein